MEKTLQVEIKLVYGNETIYPVNELAKKFAGLLGKKTLARHDITKIKELGFNVELVTTARL